MALSYSDASSTAYNSPSTSSKMQAYIPSHTSPLTELLTPPFSGSIKPYDRESCEELDLLEDIGPSFLSTVEGSKANILAPGLHSDDAGKGQWRPNMSLSEKKDRRDYLMQARAGRKGLRVVIVTENFLPKWDGVTKTLCLLLEHMQREGHSVLLLGPESDRDHFASHPLVGTWGIPLIMYPSLRLNFLRPKFLSAIARWEPDVVHLVDPIWLGGQTLKAMEYGWAGKEWERREKGDMLHEEVLEGAVTASYHTNIATYASLFGLPFLEPLIWRIQRALYSQALVTMCPSQSTATLLGRQGIDHVRLWSRGVDLSQFSPSKRDAKLRASWGIATLPAGFAPPLTPPTMAADSRHGDQLANRPVAMYVGRISWEKNLHLLIAAVKLLPTQLSQGSALPKVIFVGDGPARSELEYLCQRDEIDAIFAGHRSGEELAAHFASADVFLFPSFTETFGQVITEAMASGLPVVGLDADGTRDLVVHGKTGLLLSPPKPKGRIIPTISSSSWPRLLSDRKSEQFASCAEEYARLIVQITQVGSEAERQMMGHKASTEGIAGRTWYSAMESCVDGFREALRMAKDRQERRASQAEDRVSISALLQTARRNNLTILIAAIVLLLSVLLYEVTRI